MRYPTQDVYEAVVAFLHAFYFADKDDDLGAMVGSMNIDLGDNRSMDPAFSAEWDEIAGGSEMDAGTGFRAMLKLLERNVPGFTGDTDYLPRLLQRFMNYEADPELFRYWEATLRSVYEENRKG